MKTLASAILIVSLTAASAAAQGRGKAIGKARGGPTTSGSAAPSASSATNSSGAGVRQFGAWLDDASLLDPGDAWTALSFGHYKTSTGHQTDFPVVDATIGLTPRAQFGITVPYYRVHFTDGSNLHGLGDVYLTGKFSVIDPTHQGQPFGLAVSPMIELLDEATSNSGRFAWAVPVSLEFRSDRYRMFGSTGYFSRGAIFLSGALEVPVHERFVLTGALSMMRSTNDEGIADALNVSKSRADATATAAYFLTPSIALFGGMGRTISSLESSGTSFMVSGGLSMTFAPRITP